MILVVQTNVAGRLCVWAVARGRVLGRRTRRIMWHGSDRALTLVDRLLSDLGCTVDHLTGLVVVRGPGSFTAVRTGLLIANTLSMLLRLPVRGVVRSNMLTDDDLLRLTVKLGGRTPVRPWYGKSPNITRPKTVAGRR